jgi:hypothetical protein
VDRNLIAAPVRWSPPACVAASIRALSSAPEGTTMQIDVQRSQKLLAEVASLSAQNRGYTQAISEGAISLRPSLRVQRKP